MKKIIASLALGVSALVATAPAAAQYYPTQRGYDAPRGGYGYNDRGDLRQRLDRIAMRIDRGNQRGALTNGEARRLRNQLDDIARLEQRYRYDGISRWEFQDLNRRVSILQQRVQNQRFDDDRRGW